MCKRFLCAFKRCCILAFSIMRHIAAHNLPGLVGSINLCVLWQRHYYVLALKYISLSVYLHKLPRIGFAFFIIYHGKSALKVLCAFGTSCRIACKKVFYTLIKAFNHGFNCYRFIFNIIYCLRCLFRLFGSIVYCRKSSHAFLIAEFSDLTGLKIHNHVGFLSVCGQCSFSGFFIVFSNLVLYSVYHSMCFAAVCTYA